MCETRMALCSLFRCQTMTTLAFGTSMEKRSARLQRAGEVGIQKEVSYAFEDPSSDLRILLFVLNRADQNVEL